MSSVETKADSNLIFFNGIDADTGQYAVGPLDVDKLAHRIRVPSDRRGMAKFSRLAADKGERDRRRAFFLPLGLDATNVADVGWGIVFPENTQPAVRDALTPLIKHRSAQAGDLFKLLDYKPEEQLRNWYARHNVDVGSFEQTRVPLYLLLIGSPTEIPFEFQYLLGLDYAVGRLSFDTADEYHRYAESIVASEKAAKVANKKEIVFWGTRHPGDPATEMSASMLIEPLANGLPAITGSLKTPVHAEAGYNRTLLNDAGASRAALLGALHSNAPPAFVFTASHGMSVRPSRPNQAADNGALLCQDWPGFGSINRQHFVSGADIDNDAHVGGMVALLFACFGAGTPDRDQFLDNLADADDAPLLAPNPFVAALPRRLLAHPKGSSLAIIGHVDRAWGCSIRPDKVDDPQIGVFRNSLCFILKGAPVGLSVSQNFSHRFASLSTILAGALAPNVPDNRRLSDRQLVAAWLERNDAQNFVVLGDPAVRLRPEALNK